MLSRPKFPRTPLKCAGTLLSLAFVCWMPSWASAHGDLAAQIEAATRAIESEPSSAQRRVVRAELHRRHADFAAALLDLDAASRLSPELNDVDYFRALVLLDSGRHAQAEALLGGFLGREPQHSAGHEARARALLQLGRPLDAARAYDRVIAQQPVPIPDDYLARARAFAAAGEHYLEEAVRGLDQGIAVMGEIVTLEQAAVELELRRGASDAALVRLERITRRSARAEMWLLQRGEILARLGRSDEAKHSFALALVALDELSPQRRRTPAAMRLEQEIRANLAALANPPPTPP